MAIMSIIWMVVPTVTIVSQSAANPGIAGSLFLMSLVPAVIPAAIAAYSVVGEREQGTLEPVLTTPIRREEFLLGKALAVLAPTLVIAYVLFGVSAACIEAFAHQGVATAVFHSSELLVLLIFSPLFAGWSIWVGIAISARSRDVRVAQQLATVGSLVPLGLIVLLTALGAIDRALPFVGVGFLVIDVLGWRIVSPAFDRERLVAGSKS
jgi:ABC-type Na+ efflux pump permease subunit